MHVGEHFILYRKTYLVHTWTSADATILSLAMVKGDVCATHQCCMSRDKCNGYLMQVVNAKTSFMNLLERIALWHVAGDLWCDLVTILKFTRANFALVSCQLRHRSSEVWCSPKLLRIKLMFTDRLCFRAYSCHNILFSSVNLNC